MSDKNITKLVIVAAVGVVAYLIWFRKPKTTYVYSYGNTNTGSGSSSTSNSIQGWFNTANNAISQVSTGLKTIQDTLSSLKKTEAVDASAPFYTW
jgi:hypothetical protein